MFTAIFFFFFFFIFSYSVFPSLVAFEGVSLAPLKQTSQLSQFHHVSHGFTAFLKVSLWLLHFSWFYKLWVDFSQTHSFLRKQTKAAHSNAAEERISSMINKNKTRSHSSLSLNGALLFIVLVKTHDNPFQWNHHLVSKYWGIKAVFHTVDFVHGNFSTRAISCDNMQTIIEKTFWSKCNINFFEIAHPPHSCLLGKFSIIVEGSSWLFICSDDDIHYLYWFVSIN